MNLRQISKSNQIKNLTSLLAVEIRDLLIIKRRSCDILIIYQFRKKGLNDSFSKIKDIPKNNSSLMYSSKINYAIVVLKK